MATSGLYGSSPTGAVVAAPGSETSGLYGSSPTGATVAAPGSETAGLYGSGVTFGGTYFEYFIFIQSETQPATPTGGSWSFSTNVGTPPTGWSNSPPPAPTMNVWASIALVNSATASSLTWSEPGQFAYAAGLPILSGSSIPLPGDGVNSQLYIQTGSTPQTIWFKESGTWTRLTGSTLYVDLVNNQTIGGTKTFSSQIQGSISGTSSNVTGTVAIANGGTGQITANSALNALLPSQATNATKVLTTDGTNTSWQIVAGSGTVTSVNVSGGTTGLTTSGGPVTVSGTITLGGTLGVANGGTGATTLTGYVKGSGTSALTASSTVPTTDLSGTITNAQLANSTISGVSLGSNLYSLTIGSGLTGASYNGSAAVTIANSAPMVYPSAGIANSTGSAWDTSYSTTGTGSVLALATAPTLNNPTISNYENWTGISAPTYTEGRMWYDSAAHALAYYNDSSTSTVHIGQDLIIKVINNTGSTIANGSPVYITGTSSGQTYPNIALAKADVASTSSVIGLTNGAIANGAIGYVTSQGGIDNVNTGTFTVGQVLYLSPYSAGQLMNTIPPTGITVQVGVVSYVDTSAGKIYVKQTTPLSVPASIITGQVAIANGGTGQSTANAAFNALAPAQTGNSGKYLTTDGTNTSWAVNPLGTVTSVAATVPSFLSISGSPITTSGTLAFGLSGTALPTTSGGTGLTSFTSGGVVYASSTSALTTGSALQFDGANLGLGVTPSAWFSTFKGIDQPAAALYSQSTTNSFLTTNSYLNTSAQWIYKNSAAALYYGQNSTGHAWHIAPSGIAGATTTITSGQTYTVTTLSSTTLAQWQAFFSALTVLPTVGQSITATATGTLLGGATVTQTITFTQAMTLDASGNLLVAKTSNTNALGWAGLVQVGGANPALSLFGSSQWDIANYGGNLTFWNGSNERVRINSSGNVGVGTTNPAAKLESVSTTSGAGGWFMAGQFTAANYPMIRFAATTPNKYSSIGNNADGGFQFLVNGTSGAVGTTALIIDASANLGLGVTPNPWANMKAIQLGDGALAMSADGAGAGDGSITWNGFYNGSNWVYTYGGGGSARYRQNENGHAWFNAASGLVNTTTIVSGGVYSVYALGSSTLAQWQAFFSALTVLPTVGQSITATATGTLLGGGTVSQTIIFTQAMTLDASGNLLVGGTSTLTGSSRKALLLNSAAGQLSIVEFGVNGTLTGYLYSNTSQTQLVASGARPLIFETNSSERARIDSSGALIVNSTSAATTSVLTLQETSSLSAALAMRNRNSTQTWKIAVDASAVDDKILAFIDNATSTVRMGLTDTGNLGLGVTPSAWGSGTKAIEIGGSTQPAYLAFNTSASIPQAFLYWNAYYNGTHNVYKYNTISNVYGVNASGQFVWFNAPSGTTNTTTIVSGSVYAVYALGSSTLAQWQAFFSGLSAIPSVGQSITATATGTLLGGGTVSQTITFTQAMTLDASGNLLIGTTSGAGKLTVTAPANQIYGTFDAVTDGYAYQAFKYNGSEIGEIGQGSGIISSGSSTNFGIRATNNLLFAIGTTERARIDSSGNLLVGTTTANARIEAQNGTAGAAIRASNSAGGFAQISVESNATSEARLTFTNVLKFIDSSTERVRIDSSGNLLVGTTSQYGSAKLSVNGSITATSGWTGTNSTAGKLGGVVQPFFCERNGTGTATNVMAFGNGSTAGKGIRMPFAGKLVLATLTGTTITGTVTVDVYKNGTANSSYRLTATATAADIGVTQDFSSSPLSFAAGDTIGWYQTVVPTIANTYNVCFYVIFD